MIKNGMRAIHPGEILREEYLIPIGLSTSTLVQLLHVTPTQIQDIVHEKCGISADIALRLAKLFETSPQFWLNLQQAYDLKIAEHQATQILTTIQPYQYQFA